MDLLAVGSLSFLCSENVFIFPSFLKAVFTGYWFWVASSFLSVLKNLVPLPFDHCGLWCKVCCDSVCVLPRGRVFFSGCLQEVFFFFSFQFNYGVACCAFFCVSCLDFIRLLDPQVYFSFQIWGIFQALFLWVLFQLSASCSVLPPLEFCCGPTCPGGSVHFFCSFLSVVQIG